MSAHTSEELRMLLLRSLWSGFCIPNQVLLPVFGNLYLKDTVQSSVVLVWYKFLAAVLDHLFWSNAKDAECIRATILSDDVIDDNSLDDGTESNENYVEPKGDSKCAEDATSDNYCCNEVDATAICFQWKDKMMCGKSSTHVRHKCQNILTKLPGVIGHARNATAPFETWNFLVTDKISDNTDQHTNNCILINQPNVSRESDAKLTDNIKIKASISLPCLAGALRSNKQSMEEFCGT